MSDFRLEISGMDEVLRDLRMIGSRAHRNLDAAMADSAMQTRELLYEATKGPKSGRIAKVAELWQVRRTEDGWATENFSEEATYLEFGVGEFNEGPGHKGKILPRKGKALSWVNEEGKRVFVKSVRGFKGIAMVRGNWPLIKRNFEILAQRALDATLKGQRYA